MNVITELVSSINRKDEMPNKILAKKIAETNNANAVKVLIGLLQDENKDVWYNSIKVLYETGALKPGKISGYCTELLVEQLAICPSNQLPMYAESFLKVIRGDHKGKLLKVLTSRVGDFEKEPKRKRVEKVIKKLQLR